MSEKKIHIWIDPESYEKILNNYKDVKSIIVEARGYDPMELTLKKVIPKESPQRPPLELPSRDEMIYRLRHYCADRICGDCKLRKSDFNHGSFDDMSDDTLREYYIKAFMEKED